MLKRFKQKVTMEWVMQQTESMPDFMEVLGKSFNSTPEQFKDQIRCGNILRWQMMLKIGELWLYAFFWQIVLRQPAKQKQ